MIPRHFDFFAGLDSHGEPPGARAVVLMAVEGGPLENAFCRRHQGFRTAVGEMVAAPERARRAAVVCPSGKFNIA